MAPKSDNDAGTDNPDDETIEIRFPVEFVVRGTPLSLQARLPQSRQEWRDRIRQASKSAVPAHKFASTTPVAVTIYYFPVGPMQGDVDNIVKPILDALSGHIFLDDNQVHRVVVQKFEPGNIFPFSSPSAIFSSALGGNPPVLYVRLSDDPFEELS